MLITFLTLIIVAIHFFSTSIIHPDPTFFAILMLVSGVAILLSLLLFGSLILIPLQNLEQKLIPNLMEFARNDHLLRIGRILPLFFSLISMISAPLIPFIITNPHYQYWFFPAWIIFFGLTLDTFRYHWRRSTNLLNPPYLVNQISQAAIKAIQNGQNDLLRSHLDNLAEVALISVEKSKLALSTQSLQAFPPIIQAFLSSAKSISHMSPQPEKGHDEASFLIFYLLQRLELINDRALRERLETICRQMIMSLGKVIIYCAQCDLSMVSFPTHFLTKFGLKAQQHHFEEVAVLTTSTLLEIAKTILTEIDITYTELKEPFQAIINGLDAIAKNTFKKRKDTSIKVLAQPFLDLKALFQTEKMAKHRDTPAILQEIDRLLEEYHTLEQVMLTMPLMPSFTEELPQ